ncbi:MAG: 4Fe-4S binding protein [Deltaproteobacteria bacterium]|nr:4Fe-4S binding protein [Deltaproteobacteria bacterium]
MNLLKNHTLNYLLKTRAFQFILQIPFVLIFILIILAGLYGASLSSSNIATVVTWTIWWGGLIFTFPLIGRAWCLVCPWAAISDWVQRLAFWKKKETGLGLDKKFPIWLRNMYPVIISFLIITWAEFYFSAVSNPKNTAYIAIIFLIAAVLISIIFERRSFCRYLCPIGGMIGIYSKFSLLELRARDKAVCRACNTKDCINGNEKGYGCPVFEYPEAMDRNTYCVLCTECVKTCPKDNIALNIRPVAKELTHPSDRSLDESLMILAAFAIVIFHGITMIPVWFKWTDAIMMNTGIAPYALVTIALFGFTALTVLVYLFFVLLTHGSRLTTHDLFVAFAYPLIPLALFFHLSHNVFHLFGEGKNLLIVSSDPFGWGWNLFGTRGLKLEPIISFNMIYYLEIALAILGTVYAIYLTYKTSLQDFEGRGFVSMAIMILCLTILYILMLNQPMVMRMG